MSQKFTDANELISLLSEEWRNVLNLSNVNFQKIIDKLNSEKYYPKKEDIFNALNLCPPSKIKVVIIGQDPYINENEAHGFSFSVTPNVRIPPSLRNIFEELKQEFDMKKIPKHGCLIKWVDEGVLLLNSILTVAAGKSKSHDKIGWDTFTQNIIEYIDNNCKVVFLALGNNAKLVCKNVKNKVLCYGHPSPLNTSDKKFLGCNCFVNVNEELIKMQILPIRWTIIFD